MEILKIAGLRAGAGDVHPVTDRGALRRLLKQTRPDLIHCLDLPAAHLAVRFAKAYPVLVSLSREDLDGPELAKLGKRLRFFLVPDSECRGRLLRQGHMVSGIFLAGESSPGSVYNTIRRHFLRKRPYDIALAGYYGFGNFGDDLILHTLIQQLRLRRPDISIVALTRDPVGTMEKFDVDCIHRFKFLPLLRTLRQCGCYACGGGTLLTDAASRRSLAYYAYMLVLAKKMGLTTMLLANGIGPADHPKSPALVTKALRHTDYITLRDRKSMALARELGFGDRAVLTSDLAVLFAPRNSALTQRENLLASRSLTTKGYFVVSIRPWKDAAPDLARSVARGCDQAARLTGLTPVLLPVQPEKDLGLSRQVLDAMTVPAVLFDRECTDAHVLYTMIAASAFCVSMRLHPLICAFAAGLPTLGLSYDQKVPAFLTDSRSGTWLDVKDLTEEDLLGAMEDLAKTVGSRDPDPVHLSNMRRSIADALDRAVEIMDQNS